MIKLNLLIVSFLFTALLFGQKTKTNTAKIEFTQFPTVPVEGMKNLGIQVYTADLPFNKDTLRLYLGNMDLIKSDAEQVSKVGFKALNEVSIVGGEGDITIEMAFGEPMVLGKELKTSSCMVAKDGCIQYYYKVKYLLPAVVQARNSEGVLNTWELASEMELQFGNEQVEKHQSTEKGSTTSIHVINYTSELDLSFAFESGGEAALARKGIVTQIGKLAESIYNYVFFEETQLKLDITYGSGKTADYTETETASESAVTALENKDYASLAAPVKIWESWLERYDAEDKKAAVNNKVTQGLHENLSIAYTFTGAFDKARNHLDKAIKFSETGFVNENEVNKLKQFHLFIDKQEKVKQHNSSLTPTELVTAPDIKKILARRKYNEDIHFLIAEDKFASFSNGNDEVVGGEIESSEDEISLEGRVENDMLILSGIVDGNMRGKALPVSICEYPNIKVIRARNIGLTSLPDCISGLTKLENLYINSNSFEVLPDAFSNMQNLKVLDISNNNLKSLPASIYTLVNLEKIFVSGNQFPEEDMKKLKESLPDTKFK